MADPTPAAGLADTHGVAIDAIPYFATPPDQPDQMMVIVGLFLLAVVVSIGLIYFQLHAIPERMAHRASHTQFQLVGILALLALFTHNSVFWVGALLLAALNVPDFLTPLNKIADAMGTAASRLDPRGREPSPETAEPAWSAAPTEPAPASTQPEPDAAAISTPAREDRNV